MRLYKNKIFGVLFFSALILFDQLSKYIIRLKSGFYICNPNLAFGLSKYFTVLFIFLIFSLSVIFLITHNQLPITKKNLNYKIKNFIRNWKLEIRNLNTSMFLSILLVLSGAISNIIDRLYFGCVIDFIHLPFWPAFNFADIFITLGFVLLAIKIIIKNETNH